MNTLFHFVSSIEDDKTALENIGELPFDMFDNAIANAVNALNDEISDRDSKIESINGQLSNFVEERNGAPNADDIELLGEMGDLGSDQHWANEHLNAMVEMQIVYMFKSLEIRMKLLIKQAYSIENLKSLYKWENMKSFFKTQGISLGDLAGQTEVHQLKQVNNAIKHNGLVNDEIKSIPEFAEEEYISASSMVPFYGRIKPKIQAFVEQLVQGIIKERYEFDDEKIQGLAGEFKKRMNPEVIRGFAEKLTDS